MLCCDLLVSIITVQVNENSITIQLCTEYRNWFFFNYNKIDYHSKQFGGKSRPFQDNKKSYFGLCIIEITDLNYF